jgi:hypothetical protein
MRQKCKKVIDKADKIRDYLLNNPTATYKDVSNKLGIPISTVHRIAKDSNIIKTYDLRRKSDKVLSILEGFYND